MTPIPLSLYVHIPWCVRKCPYCDFNSHAQREETLPEAAYVTALLDDLREEYEQANRREIKSIFIGGGTPSLFSHQALDQLLSGIAKITNLASDIEITLEANPGTFEQAKFDGFKAAGVNRLSIGIQSFNDQHLKALGRIHSANEAITAVEHARKIFSNINLDLMHGLPTQSNADAMRDLSQAIALAPDHISWYQLTIEPNTEFHARPPSLPVDEILWSIQEDGQALLAKAGFKQYEVSAYAQAGRQAKHNLNYWQFGDYMGIGAGAHGKVTQNGAITRRWKQKQPKRYMALETRLGGEQVLASEDLPFEFMMNALRLNQGVPASLYADRTGQTLEQVTPLLQQAKQKGLLEDKADWIAPTPQGRLFLNDLLGMFLED
ncbi:MAG: radical SAM family heme chaperone HemW [Pontibacterium sp.]